MDEKSIFNAVICIIGIAIFLIHSIDLILKPNKRNDEKNLLVFFIFTALHFATYLTFVLIKPYYTSNRFIMAFYTAFYIMNNLELFLLYAYAISYIGPKKKTVRLTMYINIILFTAFCLLDLANLFGRFLFTAESGVYARTPFMIFSQGYQFIGFVVVFILAVTSKQLSKTEKAAFGLYCFLPLVAIVIQNLTPGYAVAYLSILVSTEILFLFANVRKNNALAEEEKKTKEAEIKLMMSQIRPHFIYNALSSISVLIETDPKKAQKGLDNFTEYLRTNLSSLSSTHLIPFSDELKHIQVYLSLEEMRFEERLNVVYDIQDADFLVPPLSIQPLVENAVKHGIMQRIEGGTITLKTYQTEHAHIVEIADDGVGFDPIEERDGTHIGLQNVAYRVATMCNGEMDVKSEINKGATITLAFQKEGR